MSTTSPQTWQIVNQDQLAVLETQARQPLDVLNAILDSKLDYPFRLSLSGNILTINSSEVQSLKSDGSGGTQSSFKVGAAPIGNTYVSFGSSTLNFSTGATSGPLAVTFPSVPSGHYVWLGLVARSETGVISDVWGVSNASSAAATYPSFESGTAIAMVLLQSNGSGFNAPTQDKIVIFKSSGGGTGGGGNGSGVSDFVPVFASPTQYYLQSTGGRTVRLNGRFYYLNSDLVKTFSPSVSGTWYFCIDTSHTLADGPLTLAHLVETQVDPDEVSFPQNLCVIGSSVYSAGETTQSSFKSYSPREMDYRQSDFTPSFVNWDSSTTTLTYNIQSTFGRKSKLLTSYFWSSNTVTMSFTPTASGKYYISIDTGQSGGPGHVQGDISDFDTLAYTQSPYIYITQQDPTSPQFSPSSVALGEFTVTGAGPSLSVSPASFFPYNFFGPNGASASAPFVPIYLTPQYFTIRSTAGSLVHFNGKYYSTTAELYVNWLIDPLFPNSTYYICLDTSQPSGVIPIDGNGHQIGNYIVMSPYAPSTNNFNPYYAPLGQYNVVGGVLDINSVQAYSTRQVISWVHGLPNVKTASQKNYISNTYSSYFGTIAGTATAVKITANNVGASGSVTLTFNGSSTINSVISAWNAANPANTLSLTSGNGSQTPSAGSISLKGIGPGTILSYNYGWGFVPDVVNYRYYDSSTGQVFSFDRSAVELSLNSATSTISYQIGVSGFGTLGFGGTYNTFANAQDYFEVEVLSSQYLEEGGFATPKTDFTSDWFTSNASLPTALSHNLFARPQNISLEWCDSSLGLGNEVYWVEDGNQYVNRNVSIGNGIGSSQVKFDWTTLLLSTTLSSNLKVRVHMNLSKVSAGAFVGTTSDAGVVSTTGQSSKARTPDLILTSASTNFGSMISNNQSVLVTEDIVVSTSQNISATGVSFDMLPGKYIICNSPMNYVVGLSGSDFEVENLRIKSTNNVDMGLQVSTGGIVKNVTIKQNGVGKQMLSGVRVFPKTPVVASIAQVQAGVLNSIPAIQTLKFLPNITTSVSIAVNWVSGVLGQVQTLSFSSIPTQGTYTLTLGAATTASIAYNATAAAVQSALIALSGTYVGKISVSGNYIKGFIIAFDVSLGSLPLISTTLSLTSVSNPTEGSYTITWNANTTASLNYNSVPTEIQNALQALPGLGTGKVIVTGDYVSGLTLTFSTSLGPVSLITTNLTNMFVGGPATIIGRVNVVSGTISDSFLDSDNTSEIMISDNL